MKIGILGAGNVGGALGRAMAREGHEVMFSSRTPDSPHIQQLLAEAGNNATAGTVPETVAFGEVIVIAISWQNGLREALAEVTDWTGKVIIDTTNRLETGSSPAQEIAELTGAPLAKAFNTIGFEQMEHPIFEKTTMLVAGDEVAKTTIAPLVADLGFEMVDVGLMQNVPHVESVAKLWIFLMRTGAGRDFAFQLVRK